MFFSWSTSFLRLWILEIHINTYNGWGSYDLLKNVVSWLILIMFEDSNFSNSDVNCLIRSFRVFLCLIFRNEKCKCVLLEGYIYLCRKTTWILLLCGKRMNKYQLLITSLRIKFETWFSTNNVIWNKIFRLKDWTLLNHCFWSNLFFKKSAYMCVKPFWKPSERRC